MGDPVCDCLILASCDHRHKVNREAAAVSDCRLHAHKLQQKALVCILTLRLWGQCSHVISLYVRMRK